MCNYKIINSSYSVVGEFSYSIQKDIYDVSICNQVFLNLVGGEEAACLKYWIRNRMSSGTFSEQMKEIDSSGGACLSDEYFIFKDDLPSVISFPFCQGVSANDTASLFPKRFLYVTDSDFRIGRIPKSSKLLNASSYSVISVSSRATVVRCE